MSESQKKKRSSGSGLFRVEKDKARLRGGKRSAPHDVNQRRRKRNGREVIPKRRILLKEVRKEGDPCAVFLWPTGISIGSTSIHVRVGFDSVFTSGTWYGTEKRRKKMQKVWKRQLGKSPSRLFAFADPLRYNDHREDIPSVFVFKLKTLGPRGLRW